MKTTLDVGIPFVAFLIMVVVGLELTVADFRKVIRSPRMVTAALIGQILLLPLCAVALVQILHPKPHIMTGLLLIAACPAGGLSNYYTCLARANTALSVSLTAGSCVAALATMPVVIAAYELYLGTSIGFEVPAARLLGSLVVMLVLPVLTGMALRHYRTAFVTRHETTFKAVALAGLTVLIAYVVSEEGARVIEDMTEIAVAGTMFVGLAMGTGYAVGALSGEEARDSFTLLIEFAVRNVGIATAIAVTILGRVDFAVFAAAYFLIETPILFAAVILFKMKSVPLSRVSIPSVQ